MVPWVRHKMTCFTVCYLQCLPLLHWKLTAVPGNEVITAAVESVRPRWKWISDQTRQSLFLFSQGQNKQTTTTTKTAVHWFMSCRWLTCHRLVAEVVVAVVRAKKNRQVKTTQVSTKCIKYVEKYNVSVYLGKADCIKVRETKVLLKKQRTNCEPYTVFSRDGQKCELTCQKAESVSPLFTVRKVYSCVSILNPCVVLLHTHP